MFDFEILKSNETNIFDFFLVLFLVFISFFSFIFVNNFFPACSRYTLLNKKSFISMVIYSDLNEDDKDILLNEFNKILKQYPNKTAWQVLRFLFAKIEEDITIK